MTNPEQPGATPDGGREAAVMSVRGAAVWAMSGQYISFGIQFVSSVLISRFFLAPAEVGLFSIAMAAALLASVLQDFGLVRYIASLPVVTPDEIKRCSSVSVTFSLLVAGSIALTAFPMARAYGHPDLMPIMLIIACSYLFNPFSVVPMALLGRTMSFHSHFAINVSGAVAQAVVALALAAMGFSAFSLAWGTLASGMARGLVAQVIRPALPLPFSLKGTRSVIGAGSRLSSLYLIGALGNRTPDMVVGKILGLIAVGLYSRAASLSEQFRILISGAIGSVFFPAFARIRDRGESLAPAYLRVCAGYSAVIWPGMAGLAMAAEPIVRMLYGPKWAGVSPLLSLIAIMDILLISLPLANDIPILLGRLNRLTVYNVIDTTMSIALLVAGSMLGGVEGAAASRLVYAVAWIALYARFLQSLIGFSPRDLLTIYAKSTLATAAAILPMTLVYTLLVPPDAIDFFTLAAASAAGVVLWFVTLVVTRHPALHDLLALSEALPMVGPIGRRLLRYV
ncbi:oligosaccharide flippase family protein [Novosphingobium sp. ZN18A2]|uniref:oligosaccharide flippase family protein n=1 Tax=Novosphingobium sp. ZN18A2 TaxID=3079861 RepID=UPI0030D2F1AC